MNKSKVNNVNLVHPVISEMKDWLELNVPFENQYDYVQNLNESWEVKIFLDSERYQNIFTTGGVEQIIAMIQAMDNRI